MKSFYLKFTKKTFLTLFLGISLLFASQGIQAATITSTAAGGDWNSTSTWEGGVIPANSTADYVIILGTATVNLNLTANFTVGALDINQGGKLNVSQDATARTFTLGILTPGSTIAGALLFDASVTGSKSFGKVTVTTTGSVIETTKVSISINNGANGVLTNYGIVTTGTLAMSGTSAALMNIYNYGTINSSTGFSSTTVGTFTNYSTGIFNHTGTVAGTINNFGTINSASLSGTAATAIINNKATGVLNYTGSGAMSATNLVLDATEAGNTVNYSLAGSQTVKEVVYSNLILSNSGTKTIGTAASGTLCTGKMTISGTAKASVTNTNLGVNLLFLSTTGQAQGTIGFTGSGATTISTAYFTTGTGSLNVQQTYSITSTAVGGDWNSTSTWVDGVVPANSSAEYVTIVGTATVNLNLTANLSVGALKINQGGTLNVTGNFTFTIGNVRPYTNIAGTLNITGTSSRTIDNLTVASTGIFSSTGSSTSIGSNTSLPWVNNGTVTLTTLGLTASKTFDNNGTFTCSGIGSSGTGIINNNSGATFTLNGNLAGTINNYGTMNSTSLAGSATVANVINKATGVLNFTGSSMTATNLVLTATDAGNTVNYSLGGSQTVKDVAYSNLILSTSGTKTIGTAASSTLCTGKLTISGTAKANVTNANLGVNLLFLGTTGQTAGTVGFTGSGATTINTAYFTTGLGTLNVQQTYSITSTAVGGDWNSASTWVDGVVPANSSADYVTIVGTATVNLNLTANFTVGALKINQGGILNVSSNASTFTFAIASRSPYSEIVGSLNLDTTTGSKSFGNITVNSGGAINCLGGATSVGSTTSVPWVNNGTISMITFGLTTDKTVNNNGTFTCKGIGSTSQGIFNNNNGGTFNLTGAIAGTINNYGTINSSQLSGSAAVANITNYNTGILNYSGAGMYSTTLVLNATTPGNVVNYNLEGDQLIKPTSYSNLSLSGIGNKNVTFGTTLTIPVNGVLTIAEGVNLNNSGIINNLGTITNNGNLVQRSNDVGTGSLLSTSSINNVTQQRYFTSNQRGWRLISNPLSSTTFSALATDSGISLGTNFTGEYVPSTNTWTSTDATATLDTQKAYKVFITGLTGESSGGYLTGPSNVTLVNKGTAANTEPATINTVTGEYYLVANPYTAPVSVASILAASTNLSSTVSYYNPANASTDVKIKAGGYDFPIVSGVSGSETDVVIPPMGAIFVLATSNGTINVPKSAIFTGIPSQTVNYNQKNSSNK